MYNTPEGIRGEILSRPKMAYYEDDNTNKIAVLILRCINKAEAKLWEKYKDKAGLYEKPSTILTLPAATDVFGADSSLFILNSGSTPALPADVYQLKTLSVIGDAGAKTDSKSTYDTDVVEGTGIPADGTVITTDDVYHELVDEDDDIALRIVIGDTAAGAMPKVQFSYKPKFAETTGDTDEVLCPRGLFETEFMPAVNTELKLRLGHDGF